MGTQAIDCMCGGRRISKHTGGSTTQAQSTRVSQARRSWGNEIFKKRKEFIEYSVILSTIPWSQNHSGYHQCLNKKYLKLQSNSSLITENLMNPPQQCRLAPFQICDLQLNQDIKTETISKVCFFSQVTISFFLILGNCLFFYFVRKLKSLCRKNLISTPFVSDFYLYSSSTHCLLLSPARPCCTNHLLSLLEIQQEGQMKNRNYVNYCEFNSTYIY